jgi:hypothetical protein
MHRKRDGAVLMKDIELIRIEDVISLLRLQKHDFLNHLQVVAGFLHLNKQAMAHEYLMEAIAQIQREGKALRIQSPELVGVLYHYKAKGEQVGIKVKIEVADEILELGQKGKTLAQFLKEMLELILLQAGSFQVEVEISFVPGERGGKICKTVLTIPELDQEKYKKMEKINTFIDEESAAYYNQIENRWIIEVVIE